MPEVNVSTFPLHPLWMQNFIVNSDWLSMCDSEINKRGYSLSPPSIVKKVCTGSKTKTVKAAKGHNRCHVILIVKGVNIPT